MSKVTVVIPNYNHERYLAKRIDSVLAQNYKNFDIIILDDKSTDHSIQVIEQYRKLPNVEILYNETNSGSPFVQWNKGVIHAQTEYIWIAESDDYNHPDFLGTLVEVLEKDKAVALAYCKSYKVDKDDNVLAEWEEWVREESTERWSSDFIADGNAEILRHIRYGLTIPNASSVVFRKDCYINCGLAPTDMRIAGDWMTWTKLLHNNKLAFVSQHLNFFRTHTENVRSKTYSNGLRFEEEVRVILFATRLLNISGKEKRSILSELCKKYANMIISLNTFFPLPRASKLFTSLVKEDPMALLYISGYFVTRPFKSISRRI